MAYTTPNKFSEAWGSAGPADISTCITDLVNAAVKGLAPILSPHGLAPIDFALLRLLLEAEEWTTTQLADALPLAPSGISRSVTRLVGMGLIKRRRLLSDRRVVILTLTDKGTALTQGLHNSVQSYHARLYQGVSEEEMEVFASVSSRVKANYATMGRCG
ncbi:MAG: MarR family transcriptional regulator [Chloroflexi bacterium]|nr:MarR family transcriptional regulator [Chloroflexota bacterium]